MCLGNGNREKGKGKSKGKDKKQTGGREFICVLKICKMETKHSH